MTGITEVKQSTGMFSCSGSLLRYWSTYLYTPIMLLLTALNCLHGCLLPILCVPILRVSIKPACCYDNCLSHETRYVLIVALSTFKCLSFLPCINHFARLCIRQWIFCFSDLFLFISAAGALCKNNIQTTKKPFYS